MSRLAAQDVTVTDPVWFDQDNPPVDQPPRFKKQPKPVYPEALKNVDQVAYCIFFQIIDEKGKALHKQPLVSNPYIRDTRDMDMPFAPVRRKDGPLPRACIYAVVFNPKTASPENADAAPRVLAVSPLFFEKNKLPPPKKTPLVIWLTLSLSEQGQLEKFTFDDPAYEGLRKPVEETLHGHWKFAPARRAGQPAKDELRVPLIIEQPYKVAATQVLPKLLSKLNPSYPPAMKYSGLDGKVLVEFIVDETGKVINPVIVETNNPGFNEAAIEAIVGLKFVPAKKNGKPVKAEIQQPIVFIVDDGHDFAEVEQLSKRKRAKEPLKYPYDVPPVVKGIFMPVYPYTLLRDEVEGKALVTFFIDAEGQVLQVQVIEATKPEFGQAMIAAMEAARFIPAMKEGKPTSAILKREQVFARDGPDSLLPDELDRLVYLEKKHPEKIVSAKKLDAPLQPVSRRSPIFPRALRDRLNQGEAVVEFLVDKKGKVCLPRVIEATDPAFGYAAVQAAIDWRFEPPKSAGEAVVTRVRTPFKFSLKTEPAESSDGTPAEASAPDRVPSGAAQP